MGQHRQEGQRCAGSPVLPASASQLEATSPHPPPTRQNRKCQPTAQAQGPEESSVGKRGLCHSQLTQPSLSLASVFLLTCTVPGVGGGRLESAPRLASKNVARAPQKPAQFTAGRCHQEQRPLGRSLQKSTLKSSVLEFSTVICVSSALTLSPPPSCCPAVRAVPIPLSPLR